LELSRAEAGKAAKIFEQQAEYASAEEAMNVSRKAALGARGREAAKALEGVQGQLGFIREAADRLHEFMLSEMDYAVIMPDARVRAIVTQGQNRGSIIGEIARSFTLYKQFPIAMISTHLARGASQIDALSKGRYLAELMLGLTVMGAIAVQTKDVLKGKDPGDMKDPGFWGRAFAQGGGAGIFGDFLQASESRFGKSFTSTLAGPVAGLVDDSVRLTAGNLWQVLHGQETRFAPEAVRFMRTYTPGSNAWYARLAMERLLWDQLLLATDPDAHQSFRRVMQNARRDYGVEYWWRPGDPVPERLPGQ
jgi:hypothetical protein